MQHLTKGLNFLLAPLFSLPFYTVALPTFLAIVYYGWFASDIYVSESRLVVRSPHQQVNLGGGVASLFQGGGISRAQDDTYTLRDFILSRDALHQINEEFNIAKSYGNNSVDIINRFAGLAPWNNNFEGLFRYYKNNIAQAEVEAATSIVAVTVRAFSREEARNINERLLEMSEQLINRLNERIHQDMIRFATVDVELAQKKAEQATLALAKYRTQQGIYDPEKQSPLNLTLIEKLHSDLIDASANLAQVRSLAKNNPQIPSLEKKVKALEEAITREKAGLMGENQSLSNKSVEFERLAFAREFAAKQLAETLSALEIARNEARRKQVYVERLTGPSQPDVAVEPRRIRSVFTVFLLGMISWGILALLVTGAREHQNR